MEEIIEERIPEQTQKQDIANLAYLELSPTELEILYSILKSSPIEGLFYAGQWQAEKIFPQFATTDDNIWRSIIALPPETIRDHIREYLKRYAHTFNQTWYKVPFHFIKSALLSVECRISFRAIGRLLRFNLSEVYAELYPFSGTADFRMLVEVLIYACLIKAPNIGSVSQDEELAIAKIERAIPYYLKDGPYLVT
jgi:hypothetical protein